MIRMKRWMGVLMVTLLRACAPERAMRSLARAVVLLLSLTGLGAWSGDALAVARFSVANNNWNNTATWGTVCGGAGGSSVPVAADTVTICNGTTVTLTAAASITNMSINTGGTLAAATFYLTTTGNIDISGTVSGTTGGINSNGGASLISLTASGGTFNGTRFYITGAGGTTLAAGSTLNFAGTTSYLYIGRNSGGTTVANSKLTINGTLNLPTTMSRFRVYTGTAAAPGLIVGSTGVINATGVTLAIQAASAVSNSGSVTLATVTGGNATTSIYTNAAGGTLNASVALMATGVLNASATGNTVNYTGAAQTIKAPSAAGYYNLTLSGSGAKTTAANLLLGGNLTLSGTATFTAGTSLTHTIAGSFIVNTTAPTPFTWTTASTFNFNTPATPATTTIGGTTTATLAFNTVNINNTSGVNVIDNISASGILTVGAGATLSPSAAVIVSGAGTLTGTGTVQVTTTAAGGFTAQYTQTTKTLTNLTIDYAGAAAQTVTVQTYGSATGGGLKVSNASGVSLTANTTVAGTLNLFSGFVNTGASTLITTANCTTSVLRTAGWVAGNLQLYFPTGAPNCIFHVGDAATYRPVNMAFASVTTAGGLIGQVSQAAGDHPQCCGATPFGLDSTKSVNRYWTVTDPVGGTIVYTTYSATFNFLAADYDAGANAVNFEAEFWNGTAWTVTTLGARTATSNQATGIAKPSAANTYAAFAVAEKKAANPGDFEPYDSTTTPIAALTGKIMTKIAGQSFTLDIAALNPAKTALFTTFAGTVKVELLNSSDSSGVLDPVTNCNSTWTVLQTLPNETFNPATDPGITGAAGRHRIAASITENNAYRDVRLRVSFPATGIATSIGCSTDRFAIRPNNLLLDNLTANTSVMDSDWQTAGTGRTLNNTGVSSGVVHKAGQPFTISVTAQNALGATTTNYSSNNGNPLAGTLTCIVPATNCIPTMLTPGTWSGSGTVTTTTASYSEAGAFNLVLRDTDFATVDSGDGTTADCAGFYVCSAAVPVGRFVPDHFALAANTMITPQFKTFNDAACAARSFTYAGQPFGFATTPQAIITAQNAANVATTNYTGTLWHLLVANATQIYATTSPQPLDTSLVGINPMVLTAPGAATSCAGTASPTTGTLCPSPDNIAFTRGSTPYALFPAAISLTMSISDISEAGVAGNGNITATAPALFHGTSPDGGITWTGIAWDSGNEIRFGRMKLGNALGSELLDLPIPIETQYWDGTQFVTNDVDSCTTLSAANITLGNYLGLITSGNMGASHVSFTGPFSLKLVKPGTTPAPGKGSVDVTVNLSAGGENKAYLQGGSTYTVNPTSHATFGVYKGNNNFIYLRENY